MKLKFIALLLLCTLQSFSSGIESELDLPSVPVLSLNAQEDLFVKAYEDVGPANINPVTTPVPGLAPMIEVHYSYVRGLVEKSPEDVALLKQFWQKTAPLIKGDTMTVNLMKRVTLQLSFLVTHFQRPDLFNDDIPFEVGGSGMYFKGHAWKDLDLFDLRHSLSSEYGPVQAIEEFPNSGLICEAVLCSKSGGFSFERFARNYVERSFPMQLSALSLVKPGEGPHGASYDNPARFLMHDYQHAFGFMQVFLSEGVYAFDQKKKENGVEIWTQARNILRKIYYTENSAKEKKDDMVGIFLLCHEKMRSMIQAMEGAAGKGEKEAFEGLIRSLTAPETEDPLADPYGIYPSPSQMYKTFWQDEERMLRDVYGDERFPVGGSPAAKAKAVVQGMNRFWEDFYQRNKDLFEDKIVPAVKETRTWKPAKPSAGIAALMKKFEA